MEFRAGLLNSKPHEGDNVLGLGPAIGAAVRGCVDSTAPARVVSELEGRISPESTGSGTSFVLKNGDPLFLV